MNTTRVRIAVLLVLQALVLGLFGVGTATAEPAPQNQAPAPEASVGIAAAEPVPGGAIIDNGTVALGVNRSGELNLRSSELGRLIGVNYLPTGNDGTAAGCPCEGWGAADALTGTTGWANRNEGGIRGSLSVVDFTSGEEPGGDDFAVSTTDIGGSLEVTHDYHSSGTSNLYEATVTIRNISGGMVEPRYRRVMDWDIEPTAFREFVTIQGNAGNLLFSSNNGFASANPFAGPSGGIIGPPTGAEFVDAGPADHGALFDFGFDPLAPAESVTFNIYYGAAATENDALLAIDFVGATLYSLGQPSTPTGATNGDPNTFVFAFNAVGGERLPTLSVRKRADSPRTDRGGTNGYDIVLGNGNDFPVTVNSVTDELPDGFSYVPGSSTYDGAAIADPTVTPTAGGDVLDWTGPFTVAPKSFSTLSFAVGVDGAQPTGVYTNQATADAVDPDGDPVAVRSTGPAAPVEVPPPTVATDTTAEAGSGSITTDPTTGYIVVSMTRGGRSDLTISSAVACPDGSAPTAVTLLHGGASFPMSEGPPGTWSATIPAASLTSGPLVIVAACPGGDIPNTIGEVVLYDPSGVITDAVTDDPIEGATVTLYSVPFAEPDTSTETKDCRTVDTRPEASWEDAPAADAGAGVEVDETLDPPFIDPTVNPQVTNSEGRYGWDVASGCYFIIVSASGYESRTSPLVGVPPEVTDLDLKLTPSGGGSTKCNGLTPTIVGTAGADFITGTQGVDVIMGLGGNDTINGRGGNDTICGGDGNDLILSGLGNDAVFGGDGNDDIRGGAGDDNLRGGTGRDKVSGGDGNDAVFGDAGQDSLSGDKGTDSCHGGTGNTDTAKPSCETILGVP